MKETLTGANLSVIFPTLFFFLTVLVILMGSAYATSHQEPSANDLWTESHIREHTKELIEFFRKNGWASDEIDDEELDYLLVLGSQIAAMYDLDPALVLALTSVESSFDKNSFNEGAIGLMQVIPKWQKYRVEALFEEDGEDWKTLDFYDPRNNYLVGCYYLRYILGETKGDIAYALMWYNQGAVSACENYVEKEIISGYAQEILYRMDLLRPLLMKGVEYYVPI